MPFFERFDETLDINSTSNYILLIQVEPKGLAFSILDSIRNKFILIRAYRDDDCEAKITPLMDDYCNKDDFLNRPFKDIRISVISEKSTLVPSPLYDPAKKDEFFYLNHSDEPDDIILVNKIPDPNAYIIFAIPSILYKFINMRYKATEIAHHSKQIIYQTIKESKKNIKGYHVHLHLENSFFNIMIMNHEILKFNNCFRYQSTTDILYFIFNIFNIMGIKADEGITISGKTNKQSDLVKQLNLYIKNVRFANPVGNHSFSYIFNEIDLYKYINIINLINCE